MIHARSDYDKRIQDIAGLIPEDEPVFLLRGQDIDSVLMLRIYALLHQNRGRDAIALQVNRHASKMAQWQRDHAQKIKPADQPLETEKY